MLVIPNIVLFCLCHIVLRADYPSFLVPAPLGEDVQHRHSHLSCSPPANICPTDILHMAVYAHKHNFYCTKAVSKYKSDHFLAVWYMKHVCLSKKTVSIQIQDIFSIKTLMDKFKSKLCHVQFSERMRSEG